MSFSKINLILLLLYLQSLPAYSKNYYISSSTGNDDYTPSQAQSPITPWKSLAKLNSFISDIEPGDSVLLKRGEVFTGSITINQSGTSSLPIVIGSYGKGALPIVTLPEITGWTKSTSGIYSITKQMWPAISIFYQDGKPLLNMASSSNCSDGNWWCDNSNLYYKPDSGTINDHKITVANIVPGGGYQAGIDLSNTSYITIAKVEFSALGAGIKTFDTTNGTAGITIKDCKFNYCQRAIIMMPDIENNTDALIQNCYFFRNQSAIGMYTSSALGDRPSQTHGTHIGCKILDNEMAENGTIDGVKHWSYGTDLEAIGVQNFMDGVIKNNYIHDGYQIGIIFYNLDTRSSDNNVISENRVYNNKKGGLILQGDKCDEGYSANYSFNNNLISNNIFVNSSHTAESFDGTIVIYQGKNTNKTNYFVNNTLSGRSNIVYFPTSRPPFFVIENNIIYNSGKYRFVQWSWLTKPESLVMDYNLYFEEDAASRGFQLKRNLSMSSMQSLGLEIHSKIANPLLKDAKSYDFHLQPSSPAINAGADVGLPFEGSAPDVGAFSFDTTSAIIKSPQTITFPIIVDKTFGDASFSLKAFSNSSLPISYKVVSGPAVISGNVVTLTNAGTVTIEAAQDGSDKYLSAPTVKQSFTVNKSNLKKTTVWVLE